MLNDDDGLAADLEDMASAIGHVVISHNTLQCALLELGHALWPEFSVHDIQRLFGRRSVDERLSMMAKQLNRVHQPHVWIDMVDQMLSEVRQLTIERNRVVHRILPINLRGNSPEIAESSFESEEPLRPEAAWQLSEKIDVAVLKLFDLCAQANH